MIELLYSDLLTEVYIHLIPPCKWEISAESSSFNLSMLAFSLLTL